jgi:hypothetical protein
MEFLDQALELKKANGALSTAFLMKKFKINACEAMKLMEEVEKSIIESELNKQKNEPHLKKFEMHITAEYD